MMSGSMLAGLIVATTPPDVARALVPLVLGAGILGGFYEFYFLVLVERIHRLLACEDDRGRWIVPRAALMVGLYYTVVGALLLSRRLRGLLEAVLEAPIEDTVCQRFYRPLLFVATLGLGLYAFQECMRLSLASTIDHVLSEEGAEGLGAQAYEGKEYPGSPY